VSGGRCETCGAVRSTTHEILQTEVNLCRSCSNKRILPWDLMVGFLLTTGFHVNDTELGSFIFPTCDYYGRSEAELWAEVSIAERQYNDMQQEMQHGRASGT
jgi:hypothetical protein